MEKITVKATIKESLQAVWEKWTTPDHIGNWNFASEDWHCPNVTNDLKPNGVISWRMEAKDGSMGFDFSGIYEEVRTYEFLAYTLDDGRKVTVAFTEENGETEIVESFDPDENDRKLQEQGWQAVLNNFKAYAENNRNL